MNGNKFYILMILVCLGLGWWMTTRGFNAAGGDDIFWTWAYFIVAVYDFIMAAWFYSKWKKIGEKV